MNIKRYLFVILCVHLVLPICAQEQDYPEYRSKKDNFIRVREKDIRYDLGTFTIAGLDESIGKQPLKSIPATNTQANLMKFEGEGIQVNIKSGTFDPTKHKLGYYDEKKYLLKIDNKAFYGNYGEMPRTSIEEVTVIVGKDTLRVPPIALVDLYNPTFSFRDRSGQVKTHNRVYLSADKKRIYVYMLNKETVGSYEITWVFQDKQYFRRVLDFGLMK